MSESRKEERKSFISIGQLYIAGEMLDFRSYDISVNGILVEILPGEFLTSLDDFEKLLKESFTVEFFVKELMFTGEADIVRVFKRNDSIMLGLQFRDVIYNATRLWRRRRYYRKHRSVSGVMIVNHDQIIHFKSLDVSMGGAMLQLIDYAVAESDPADAKLVDIDHLNKTLTAGQVVKIIMKELNNKAIAEIIWIEHESTINMGLKYLQKDNPLLNGFDLE